ncbi:MAG: heparinase II/III family protein [Acidobacteria bacterium]|nr:heparinase II/III family protein [Acidobacteriota bacterium]
MKLNLLCSILLCLVVASLPAYSQQGPPVPTSLKTLKAVHPRLIILDSQIPAIKRNIAADAFAKKQFDSMRVRAEFLLSQPVSPYSPKGPRGQELSSAREILEHILTLSGMYRLSGDKRFADRAVAEMTSAAQFPTWYANLLANSEFTAAMGIGYDWMYPVLTPQQRALIRDAIEKKGIGPFTRHMDRKDFHLRNNWADVFYGSATVAALAIADPEDKASMELAEKVVGYTRPGMKWIMELFAPDGGFDEGPIYWGYATIYNVLYIASMDSAVGTDFGASTMPGFEETPTYLIQATGPLFTSANFGDARPEVASPSPQIYWFANRFHRPAYMVQQRLFEDHMRHKIAAMPVHDGLKRFNMLGIFWYASAPQPKSAPSLPLVQSFARTQQAYMRTSWNDPKAWYIGFKAGEAGVSHGHLDLGSFVMDGLGERWAVDLGSESYSVPEYFGKKRWNYFRTQTRSHNTLLVDNENEDRNGIADILFAKKVGTNEYSVADLDKVYKGKLEAWKRGIAILHGNRVVVQDEVAPAKPVDIIWNFQTRSEVEIAPDGRTAILSQNGVRIKATILEPAKAHFSTSVAQITPEETANPGLTDLIIERRQTSEPETIAVMFSDPQQSQSFHLKKLADWGNK